MRRIVHFRKEPFDVYCGRGGDWGNPFVIGPDGDRAAVIEKYENWIRMRPDLIARLPELKNKVLACWCSPQRCHCEILLKLLVELGIEESGENSGFSKIVENRPNSSK